jgi:hypothetical protein
MVNHQRTGQGGEHTLILHNSLRAHIDLHVPAQPGHAPGEQGEQIGGGAGDAVEIEPNAAGPMTGKTLQLLIAHLLIHAGHGARPITKGLERLHKTTVVHSIAGWGHEDGAGKTEPPLEEPVISYSAHCRRAARHQGKTLIKDMHVAVGCAGRRECLRRFHARGIWRLQPLTRHQLTVFCSAGGA